MIISKKVFSNAEKGHFEAIKDETGQEIYRFQANPISLFECRDIAKDNMGYSAEPLIVSKAKPDPSLPKPLAPSGATAMIELGQESKAMTRSPVLGDWQNEAHDTALQDADYHASEALQRGTVLHRLMQSLPDIKPALRAQKADQYLNRVLDKWPRVKTPKAT